MAGAEQESLRNPCIRGSRSRERERQAVLEHLFTGLGLEKGVFWKWGLFRKVHFLESLETLEILEILENPQTLENKGESDRLLQILENFRDSKDSSSENVKGLALLQETPWAYWVTDFSVVGIKSQNMLVRCEMPSRSGGLSESLSFQNCHWNCL